MNKVILVGRLTKDVDVKNTANQTVFAQFTVAVQRKYKDANGSYQSDFINCVAWRQTATFISQYFHKGMKIGLTGSLQTRSYDDRNGNKVFVTEVLVEEAEFIESKQGQPQEKKDKPIAPSMTEAELTADLPFEI